MIDQIQLCDLVDLALCKPEIGAVNFNHLRAVLHAILKLTNHTHTMIDPKIYGGNAIETDQPYICGNAKSFGSPSLTAQRGEKKFSIPDNNYIPEFLDDVSNSNQEHEEDVSDDFDFQNRNSEEGNENHAENEEKEKEEKGDEKEGNEKQVGNEVKGNEEQVDNKEQVGNEVKENEEEGNEEQVGNEVKGNEKYEGRKQIENGEKVKKMGNRINSLIGNQRKLEHRIGMLENNVFASDQYPLNNKILHAYGRKSVEVIESPKDSPCVDDTVDKDMLSSIWQTKKLKSRMEAMEEAVDKLFSLMNDVLSEEKDDTLKNMDENVSSQFDEIRNHLNLITDNATSCKEDVAVNKNLIEDCVGKIENCEENIKTNTSNLEKNGDKIDKNCKNLEEMEEKMIKFAGKEKEESEDVPSKFDIDDIQLLLQKKADIFEVEKKANLEDLQMLRDEINRLAENISSIGEEVSSKASTSNLNETDKKVECNATQTESTFSDIKDEIQGVKEIVGNIDGNKLKDMIDHVGELEKLFDMKEELNDLNEKIRDISQWMEQSGAWQSDVSSKLNALESKQFNIPPPNLDSSVLAALQHLTQENRLQITSLQANMKLLQKLQMPVQPAKDVSNVDNQVVTHLQNHIIALQEEQVKLSGHISNMVDDYKDEFSRKQLHIDALYDYIEKLQEIKADKDDITVEMNVKADKQSLDNKVNMSTFDERYLMLEQALQQALTRLDQYVEQEETLKDALSKLSADLNSKMDSDAEKKLKKFLEERLKAIQVSRNRFPDENGRTNAAGLRKPMPLLYNCLSCDRPIDVTVRGVLPPVPMNMPSKKPLSAKCEKDDRYASTKRYSYNDFATNRPCGGSHTSVNINSLRMMKLSPLLSLPDASLTVTQYQSKSVTRDDDASIADCVVGKDGQIYRGRFKLNENPEKLFKPRNKSKHSKTRLAHSATPLCECNSTLKVDDRSHSADCVEDEIVSDKSFSLPPIHHETSMTTRVEIRTDSSTESK